MNDPIYMQVAQSTGLRPETVKDLLAKGWAYETKEGEPARWVSPAEVHPAR
jgi:hypothetical protein